MTRLDRIVIVGASLAGLRAVHALRGEGFTGELTLVGAERHLPYNRPPLSKSVLTGDDDVTLPGSDQLDARWLAGRRASGLDPAARRITLDDGTDLSYDGLIIATGARPRLLPSDQMSFPGVHVLRTIDDALALRRSLQEGPQRVVVIGGGFIGGEVASTLRTLDLNVTLIDAGPLPMVSTIGQAPARWLAGHHRKNGVDLISGVRVKGLAGGNDRVRSVLLEDGRRLQADLVVAGLGVIPNTDWLAGSGLDLNDGVVTDAKLFAQGAPDVVAAGDVARWPHSLFDGELVRIEHWANANEQGAVAARNLLCGRTEAEPYAEVHALGTRVHGVRIQWAGLPHLADDSQIVAGSLAEDKFAVAFTRSGVLVGGVAINFPKEAIRLRKAIAARDHLTSAF